MAYTNFSHDIFLSYRHRDNIPIGDVTEGWITLLHCDIENRVNQWLKRDIEIWRDSRLKGNDYFSDQIETQL